ncbi:MAG: TIGR00295 family protein [Candidatus Bathyarchaeota archaeon]|nr:MAG: TIGR00295 family protein [Candidatus Bathyarchaeota archaeon]
MSKRLLSDEEAIKLLESVGCSKRVVEHCKAVTDFAVELAKACKKKGLEVDVDLVRIGALLHDIGRGRTHGVDHGILGAKIARTLKLPDAVIAIIERHVGSGITKIEAKKLGWPVKSYIPESLEERVVAYADKLIEGSMLVPLDVAIERFYQDRNIPDASVERLKQWHEEFSVCLQ